MKLSLLVACVALFGGAVAAPGAGSARASPPTSLGPVAGVTMQVISFASDPPGQTLRAPGGGRVLTPGVLYQPAAGMNVQAPAIVMLDEGPGAHPLEHDQATRYAAERLAARGYTVLSLYSDQERGFAALPFAHAADAVKGALDYLEVSGHENFVLVGQSYGAIGLAHYLATQPDTLLDNGGEKRVKAVVMLNPLTELRHYPRADLQTHYEERVAQAEASVASGRGGVPAVEPGGHMAKDYDPWLLAGPYVAPAVNFLDAWGPQAAKRNAELLTRLAVPALVIASGRDPSVSIDKLRALKTGSTVELKTYADADPHFTGRQGEVAQDITRWLAAQHLEVTPRVVTHVLDVPTADGRILQGLLYRPEKALDPKRPALILVGGRTADTIQSSTQWMGTRLAAKGLAVFAPGMRVSGIAGFESSTHAEAAEDIGRWIDRAVALGYKRVVLTGHSNGGIWISNYMSLHKDPRVVGLVYFAPTRNTRGSANGPEGAQWERDLQTARAAVSRGDGMRQIIGLMTAQAWLDNNGPDTRGVHTQRVTEFDRPALSITGAKDALMTDDFVAEFNRAYRGKLTAIRYAEGSHGLRENKGRVAEDVAAWLKATFP